MWAEASPARKFLRKANYYVVTQAQSVYDILAYVAGVQRGAAQRRAAAVMSNSRRVPKKLCRPLPRRFTQSIKRKYYSLRALG